MLHTTIRLRAVGRGAPESPFVQTPRLLGDYCIIREIGRGGMGIVYEADQLSLRRRVALKVMAGPRCWDAQARERFDREARSAASLHHTNIVPIFEFGEQNDVCFYAMQYIDGIGLNDLFLRLTGATAAFHDHSPVEPMAISPELASPTHPDHFRTLARVGLQIASGLAHAHVRGIVHRDIKPANLLLDRAGVAWITDFGLAKHADDNLTQPGDFFGTLAYTAPERFNGGGDARSDIYALGLTLYELVTRRQAFPNVTDPSHVGRLAADPPRPTMIERRIPRDLETVILKAMEKDPERRYATAMDLAADLRRFLDDEPVRARPTNTFERALRWTKRRPMLASLTSAVLVLTATMIVGASVSAVIFHDLATAERAQRDAADRANIQAFAARDAATQQTKIAVEANSSAQDIAMVALGILDETDPLALSGRVFGGQNVDRGEQLKPTQVLERTLAKLEAAPEIGPKVRATLLNKIGSICVSLGQLERGGPLLEKALAIRRAEYGDDSLEAAETWHNLGLLELTQKSLGPAEQAYRRALDIRERKLGPEHPLVTVTLMHLGIVLGFDSGSTEAAPLLRRAMANMRKHSASESREYGIVTTVLAIVLLNKDEVLEATMLVPDAVRLIQKYEGKSGLAQAMDLFLQGRMASKMGLQTQATTQYRDGVRLVEKALGETHFLVVLARGELASQYQENMHDLKAAEAEYRTVQRLYETNLGVDSAQAAAAKMYLARVLRDAGRLTEAEALLREASDVLRKRQNPMLGRCLHILWEVCYKQGKGNEALPVLYEAVRERKKAGEVLWYSNAASDLAGVLEGMGKRAEAVNELREANLFLSRRTTLPPEAQWLLACRSAAQCRLLKEMGRPDSEKEEATGIAVDSLRAALKSGKTSVRDLEQRGELAPLRDQPKFQQLLAEVKRQHKES